MTEEEWDQFDAHLRAVQARMGPPHACTRECVHTLDFYRMRRFHRQLRENLRGNGPVPKPPCMTNTEPIANLDELKTRMVEIRRELDTMRERYPRIFGTE